MASPNAEQIGIVQVAGKLVSVRKAGSVFEHIIKMAAPDPYSSPATISVMAQTRLGQAEDEVKVRCRLTGYGRTYKSTDQETGEVRNVKTADNKLFAE